jgi:O-methyltransferase
MLDSVIVPNKLLPVFKPGVHKAINAVRSFAMVSRNRMQNLARLLHMVDKDRIQGEIVETGIAKGGSVVFLAMLTARSNIKRRVWGYDAFELFGQEGAGVYDEVCATIRDRFGFGEDDVKVIKGFFDDTLPDYPGDPIAFCHIDASQYEPIMKCITELYPYVQPGGVVVFDNYGADDGCRRAIDEWLKQHNLTDRLTRFGHTQAWFRKPK